MLLFLPALVTFMVFLSTQTLFDYKRERQNLVYNKHDSHAYDSWTDLLTDM